MDSFKQALNLSDRSHEAGSQRLAWLGIISSIVFVLSFCCIAGLSIWLALPFFAILGIFILVFARMRAETGIPNGFIYPFGMPKDVLLNAASIPQALNLGTQSFVIFSSLAWLSRHHFAEEQAAYQLDAAKLSEGNKIPLRTLCIALILAFAVGLVAAYWSHLSAYYHMGSNMAGGGGGNGEFRAGIARQEYEQMVSRIASPPARDMARIVANGVGFGFVGLLAIVRQRVVGLPFHPLGFLMATSYGDSSAVWFPLFVAWFCKALILRFGGMSFYRRGMPFFLGLTIGHFFFAGVLWPVLALLAAPGASQAYHLYFGG